MCKVRELVDMCRQHTCDKLPWPDMVHRDAMKHIMAQRSTVHTLLLHKVRQAAQLGLKQQLPAGPLMQVRQQRRLQQALAGILLDGRLPQIVTAVLWVYTSS